MSDVSTRGFLHCFSVRGTDSLERLNAEEEGVWEVLPDLVLLRRGRSAAGARRLYIGAGRSGRQERLLGQGPTSGEQGRLLLTT